MFPVTCNGGLACAICGCPALAAHTFPSADRLKPTPILSLPQEMKNWDPALGRTGLTSFLHTHPLPP